MIYREREILRKQLWEEMTNGLITRLQYQNALSFWNATTAGWRGKSASRFYQACGELAHKKEQARRHGDEGGNMAIIESLRAELKAHSPYVS
jgi:hypothetical protein